MPRRIEHIDKIARMKNRDVLWASFEPAENKEHRQLMLAPNHTYSSWETDENRKSVIEWLNSEGIAYEMCGHFASETGWISYGGNIYIDVPVDETDPVFKKILGRLENPDGTPCDPRVKLWITDLEEANKNSHHDEPGFWEKWAETF